MLKLKTNSNSGRALVRQLTYGLSALALAIALTGPGSSSADAQNRSTASRSGEYQIAYHVGLPHFYQSYAQPRYRPRRRTRRYRRKRVKKQIATPAWFPKEDSKDPVQVIVSLPEQTLTVYRGDKPLVTSRLSSGKPGYSTPSGVFSILAKNRTHYSNIYRGAPMPYMQRLTWSGIAFHGSNSVPKDRPASHGCIRLPHSFASQLFKFTEKGAHVVVANEKAEPVEITHDKLFQPVSRMANIPARVAIIQTDDANVSAEASIDPAEDIDAIETELAAAQSDIEVAVAPSVAMVKETNDADVTANNIDAIEAELAAAQSGTEVTVAKNDTEIDVAQSSVKVEEKERSTSPIRMLVTRRTGREVRIEVQKMLNELSFGAGDVDGYMGPDTAKAIRRFQATYGLNKDGFISDELIAMLYKVLERGAPANGHLYVRRDFNPVFDAPVVIKGGDLPLGSHLYTAMHFDDGASETRWLAVTLTKGSGKNAAYGRSAKKKKKNVDDIVLTETVPEPATASEALDRIEIAQDIRLRISKMLTPGSSLAITNDGISRETTPKGTDFIVLMQ